MAGINKVVLLGNVGEDPVIKQTKSSRPMAAFSMATESRYKKDNGEVVKHVEWHRVVYYGKVALLIEKYLKKGDQVYVEGSISTKSYIDSAGLSRTGTQIIGENVTFLGNRPIANIPTHEDEEDAF